MQIVPLDHDPGTEWLIILHGYTPHLRRYLAFKQVGHKQWQFLGGLDYAYFNGHFFAEHKLLHIGGKPYLLLRTTTGSGTGYYRYDMNLFALGAENFREVLHYIESEQMAGGPALSRVNSSQYLPPNGRENIFKVRFTRSVESAPIYPHCETTKLLNFTKSRLISFMWSAEAQKFVFNAQKSGITEEQFLRSFQDTDYESVLADRYDVLLQVARGNQQRAKPVSVNS